MKKYLVTTINEYKYFCKRYDIKFNSDETIKKRIVENGFIFLFEDVTFCTAYNADGISFQSNCKECKVCEGVEEISIRNAMREEKLERICK